MHPLLFIMFIPETIRPWPVFLSCSVRVVAGGAILACRLCLGISMLRWWFLIPANWPRCSG